MTILKTKDEIESMMKGGKILRDAILYAEKIVNVGMTTQELNDEIEKFIVSHGGEAGFKKVPGYSWATCICVNEQVVHTPPSKRVLADGDVVTIDVGVYLDGLHTDSATTVQIGTKSPEVTKFLDTGKHALKEALKQAKYGNNIGHISQTFQKVVESAGYSIIKELTGHGVGEELHEDPYIPCYSRGSAEKTQKLKPGMTLALEVMYAMGRSEIENEAGGWSIKTEDNSLTATFEKSIAILEKRTLILT
ncbi:type I methionyl aminopeptidase [Candidatus Woesebacteria bacterium]|nr:type I methionyl aminopeptidase [Candidatus Woesebacteria bacterium]